jgi:hypothetical protein
VDAGRLVAPWRYPSRWVEERVEERGVERKWRPRELVRPGGFTLQRPPSKNTSAVMCCRLLCVCERGVHGSKVDVHFALVPCFPYLIICFRVVVVLPPSRQPPIAAHGWSPCANTSRPSCYQLEYRETHPLPPNKELFSLHARSLYTSESGREANHRHSIIRLMKNSYVDLMCIPSACQTSTGSQSIRRFQGTQMTKCNRIGISIPSGGS